MNIPPMVQMMLNEQMDPAKIAAMAQREQMLGRGGVPPMAAGGGPVPPGDSVGPPPGSGGAPQPQAIAPAVIPAIAGGSAAGAAGAGAAGAAGGEAMRSMMLMQMLQGAGFGGQQQRPLPVAGNPGKTIAPPGAPPRAPGTVPMPAPQQTSAAPILAALLGGRRG